MKIRTLILQVLFLVALVAVGCENNTPVDPQPEVKEFDFVNVVRTHTKLSVDICPENKDMEYIVLLAEKKHFLMNGIDTREELLEDDKSYLLQLAQQYNISIHEFLSKIGWLVTGDKLGYSAENLYPGTEYVVYCYGVNFDGDSYEVTTPVNYTVIKTTTPQMQDVTFDVSANVDGSVVSLEVNPKGYDGMYYGYVFNDNDRYFIHDGMEITEEYMEYYRNRAYDEFNELINNQGVAANSFCYKGEVVIEERLEPNTNYQILLFAVSNDQVPILSSVPDVHYFATTGVMYSDLTIDIQVTDITPYTAELTLVPSNNDESYACVFLSKNQVPELDDEYQQMLVIIEDFMPAEFHGSWSEQLMPLMPNTEYSVIAFGIDGDLPTTKIFRKDFTSEAAEEGKIKVESIDIVKLFDASEIIALDPSYRNALAECECVAVVEMKTSSPASGLYFWWYEEWMSIEYSDEAFMEDLLMYDPSDNPTIMDMYYSMSEDDRFLFAGIAEDEAGNMSPLYYGEPFTLSKEQCDPAEEFFQYVNPQSASSFVVAR